MGKTILFITPEFQTYHVYLYIIIIFVLQYAIKLATKLNEKRLSSIAELTTLDDKPIKILDTGQRDKDRDKDNRDREREWNYKNISQNHISNNHQSGTLANHTSHVSSKHTIQSILTNSFRFRSNHILRFKYICISFNLIRINQNHNQ